MQKNKLGTLPVGKLVVELALPAIIAQIINVLYNIVDRIYIGRIPGEGDLALTGVGVTFPILILVSAFAQLIGAGGAPLAAIELGKSKQEKAEKMLGNSFSALIIISVVLTILFQIIKEPVLMAFGASEATVGYGLEYLSIYLIGTVFVQLTLGLNPFINCQGMSKVAMLTILIGAAVNIVLDPIFIFVFDFGVKGAAIATVISQAISALFVLKFLCSEKSKIRIKKLHMKLDIQVLLAMMALGVSPFIMQFTECLIVVAFNWGLQKYGGDLHVGAMTIIQSVMQIIAIFTSGLTQGIQPIISYNFGAGQLSRVRKAYRIGFSASISISTILCLTVIVFPGIFANLFTNNLAIIEIVEQMLPIFIAGMGIFGIQQATQCAFVGLGEAKLSFFLACLRKLILLIPLVLILPHFLGVRGVYIAEPVSDTLSAITAGLLFKFNIKRILQRADNTKISEQH